ncbi:hypothetical protein D3C87_2179600 [compost metagenome]
MKKISLLEIIVVMVVSLAVIFMCSNTFAADEDYNDLGNFVITNNTNTNKNNNTNVNTNTNINTNTNTNNTNSSS